MMNKGDVIKKNNYLYALMALPWVLFVLFQAYYMLKVGAIAFETNDDAFLNLITTGTFGHKYAMNVYNNVILGWIFTMLYTVSAGHNWYTILEFLLYFFSMAVVGVCNIYRHKPLKGYLYNFILLWISVYTMICSINYSKTSAFAMAAGLVLLGFSLDRDDYDKPVNRVLQILGGVILVFGGLYRKETVLALVPYIILLMVYLGVKYKDKYYKRLLPVAIAGTLILVAWTCNAIAYNADPDWRYFTEYNRARTALLDYGVPDYDEYQAEYEALGFTENDAHMLASWLLVDDEVFSMDKLNKLVEIRKQDEQKSNLAMRLRDVFMLVVYTSGRYLGTYVLYFLFLISCINTDKKKVIFQLATFLIGVGELAALIFIQRYPDRSIIVSILPAVMMIMFLSDTHKAPNKLIEYICICFVTVYAFMGNGYLDIPGMGKTNVYDKTLPNALYEYTGSHSDKLYVCSVAEESVFLTECYSPLDHPNEVSRANVIQIAGWPMPSPVHTDRIAPFGDRYRIFKVLAENPDVYLITRGNDPMIEEFMEYHFGAEPVVVDQIADGTYSVISFGVTHLNNL